MAGSWPRYTFSFERKGSERGTVKMTRERGVEKARMGNGRGERFYGCLGVTGRGGLGKELG